MKCNDTNREDLDKSLLRSLAYEFHNQRLFTDFSNLKGSGREIETDIMNNILLQDKKKIQITDLVLESIIKSSVHFNPMREELQK